MLALPLILATWLHNGDLSQPVVLERKESLEILSTQPDVSDIRVILTSWLSYDCLKKKKVQNAFVNFIQVIQPNTHHCKAYKKKKAWFTHTIFLWRKIELFRFAT